MDFRSISLLTGNFITWLQHLSTKIGNFLVMLMKIVLIIFTFFYVCRNHSVNKAYSNEFSQYHIDFFLYYSKIVHAEHPWHSMILAYIHNFLCHFILLIHAVSSLFPSPLTLLFLSASVISLWYKVIEFSLLSFSPYVHTFSVYIFFSYHTPWWWW